MSSAYPSVPAGQPDRLLRVGDNTPVDEASALAQSYAGAVETAKALKAARDDAIRRAAAEPGETLRSLGRRVGLTATQVQRIVNAQPTPTRPAPSAALVSKIVARHDEIAAWERNTVEGAIRCGEQLMEAKDEVPHGEWLSWLEENFVFSARTAQVYMDIARENPARAQDSPERIRSAFRALIDTE